MVQQDYVEARLAEARGDNAAPDAETLLLANRSRWLMGQPHGRAFVRWLLQTAGYDSDTFSSNSIESARLQGRRQVALAVRNLLQVQAPDHWNLMLAEASESRQQQNEG